MKTDALLWLHFFNSFASVFTSPTFPLFCSLSTAWLLCTGRHTITRIYQVAEPARAHDAYHRFFRCASWCTNELWSLLAGFLVQLLYPEGTIPLLLDDTAFHKTGRKIAGAAWWRDAVRSTATKTVHCFGLNILVLALKISPPWGGEPLALPLSVRLHTKGKETLLKLAEEMVTQVASWFPLRHFSLCADGFYSPLAGTTLTRTALISRIRHDAALFQVLEKPKKPARGRPRKKGKRLPTPAVMARTVRHWRAVTVSFRGKQTKRLVFARPVIWYHVCPDRPILLVICRDPTGKQKDDFFFTTDLTMNAEQVIEHYASRWAIEDTFKNVKQYLGGEDPQLRALQGPERASAFSFWIYSAVWYWYLKRKPNTYTWIPLPWYTKKATPSFVDALASLRRALWSQRIFSASDKPSLTAKNARVLIEALAYSA